MQPTEVHCARPHFEQHHVSALHALRSRIELCQEELDKARARLTYVSEQLESLARDGEARL